MPISDPSHSTALDVSTPKTWKDLADVMRSLNSVESTTKLYSFFSKLHTILAKLSQMGFLNTIILNTVFFHWKSVLGLLFLHFLLSITKYISKGFEWKTNI